MSYHDLCARAFAEVLCTPRFRVLNQEPYRNGYGRPGVRWIGDRDKRLFYFSESLTPIASARQYLANVLSRSECLDREKDPVYYAHRRPGIGIRIEAWHSGRWFQAFTPIRPDRHPDDFFSKIADKILFG